MSLSLLGVREKQLVSVPKENKSTGTTKASTKVIA